SSAYHLLRRAAEFSFIAIEPSPMPSPARGRAERILSNGPFGWLWHPTSPSDRRDTKTVGSHRRPAIAWHLSAKAPGGRSSGARRERSSSRRQNRKIYPRVTV